MEQDTPIIYNIAFSNMPQEAFFTHPDETDVVENPSIMQLDRNERLKMAVGELRIGQRIHEELKRQGRTVAWLARQLGVERTSLYYTFRQNSIDMELLYRISFFLEHDFFQDIRELYKSFRLWQSIW